MALGTRIVVAGAGAIGAYVGGWLADAGKPVTLLGRARLGEEIAQHGLRVSDLDGRFAHIEQPDYQTDPACLTGADLVLVAVKSAATAEVGALIAQYAPQATVISLQNGVSNADVLRAAAPEADVRGAVVPFNVVHSGPGAFHRASSGEIMVEDLSGFWSQMLSVPGMRMSATHDIRAQQWGKLLVNLNNALNALSGLPLLEQLQNRGWRIVLADQMAETLVVLRRAGIKPARFTALPPALVPPMLRLPDAIFSRLAKQMLTIDPTARSSMQDDLRLGRKTELAALQGEVVKLAHAQGQACPVIERVTRAVLAAEKAGNGPPCITPDDLLR